MFGIDLTPTEWTVISIPVFVGIGFITIASIFGSTAFDRFTLWLSARREISLARHYGADRQLWYRIGMPRMTYSFSKGGN